jgi:preprotein translocase subunit SecF
MEFILGCVGLYTLIGMVYPSRWHRKLVIPLGKWRIDLGRRKWNAAIFILAVILSGIIGPSYTQLRYEQDKAMKMEARLEQLEKELDQKEEQIETLRKQVAEMKRVKQEEETAVASEKNQTQEEPNRVILDDEDDDDVTLKPRSNTKKSKGRGK